ncbi:MAG: hypothetical protein M1825_002661 [Sarcosagium campestre]|nr:MAG: hypothetical protein M1825_002661 [Sarcosagium campestre]
MPYSPTKNLPIGFSAGRAASPSPSADYLHLYSLASSSMYRPSSPLSPTINPTMMLSAPRSHHHHPHPVGNPSSLNPSSAAPPGPSTTRIHRRAEPPHLSSLPRFHPSKYASPMPPDGALNVKAQPSNSSQPTSPHYLPPGSHNNSRKYSEAQRQLYIYQRDQLGGGGGGGDVVGSLRLAADSGSGIGAVTPVSPPRLHPMGSPGPVTPLLLEHEAGGGGGGGGGGDYLTAGASAASQRGQAAPGAVGTVGSLTSLDTQSLMIAAARDDKRRRSSSDAATPHEPQFGSHAVIRPRHAL